MEGTDQIADVQPGLLLSCKHKQGWRRLEKNLI